MECEHDSQNVTHSIELDLFSHKFAYAYCIANGLTGIAVQQRKQGHYAGFAILLKDMRKRISYVTDLTNFYRSSRQNVGMISD